MSSAGQKAWAQTGFWQKWRGVAGLGDALARRRPVMVLVWLENFPSLSSVAAGMTLEARLPSGAALQQQEPEK